MCFDQLKKTQDINNIVFILCEDHDYSNNNIIKVLVRCFIGSDKLCMVKFQCYKDCPDCLMRQVDKDLAVLKIGDMFMFTKDAHVQTF